MKRKPINKTFFNSLKYFMVMNDNYDYDISSRLLHLNNHFPCFLSYELYQRLLKLKNENKTQKR